MGPGSFGKMNKSLLSLSQHRQLKKTFLYKTFRGVFQSIYHEPLIVYLQKMYHPEEGVLLVRNSVHEFGYLIYQKDVEVLLMQNISENWIATEGYGIMIGM